jgi:WD40 repeat protein
MTCVVISPDGRSILTSGLMQGASLWGMDGKLIRRMSNMPKSQGSSGVDEDFTRDDVLSVAFSPHGEYVLVGGQRASLWDLRNGAKWPLKWRAKMGFVTAVAFSPDGRKMLTGFYDGAVRIWDVDVNEDVMVKYGQIEQLSQERETQFHIDQ